ncbi:DNA glycosylase superfamily protein [Euphorbia peplus]|nr:DNA glycosylase superfamily protein [Euphorbia peplus]
MCSSKTRLHQNGNTIKGRAVLEPKTNQVPTLLERRNSLKKHNPKSPTPFSLPINMNMVNSSLSSPNIKSPRPLPVKRSSGNINSSADQNIILSKSSSMRVEAPAGSIAAAMREQASILQEQRKLKTCQYGRLNNSINSYNKAVPDLDTSIVKEGKRCSFITPNSDPIYVAYHDEEWGVPVHCDKVLFELLVLTGAQVGSDWTSVLKKRPAFREAFSGFDAEVVAQFRERKIISISGEYGIDISQVRGVVDNSIRILQVKKEYGRFEKYMWGFVNDKAMKKEYKRSNKIPVKTSKSESISKDMVKRGFRNVGPTVIYSFMQAAGLTNDHLTTCPRHLQCL